MYKTVFRFDTDYRMRLGLFVRYTKLVMVVMCLSVSLSLAVLVTGNGEDIGVLADLQPVEHHQESLHADDQKENEEPSQDQKGNSGEFNIDRIFSYEADDDDWYYDPEAKERGQLIKTSTTSSIDISLQAKSGMTNASLSESRVGGEVGKAEGVISGEEPHKKVLQGPKGTIILYTAVIVILIACFVLFSVWKNAFPAGRPTHLPTHVRSGEEGKRLLDHPFV